MSSAPIYWHDMIMSVIMHDRVYIWGGQYVIWFNLAASAVSLTTNKHNLDLPVAWFYVTLVTWPTINCHIDRSPQRKNTFYINWVWLLHAPLSDGNHVIVSRLISPDTGSPTSLYLYTIFITWKSSSINLNYAPLWFNILRNLHTM